MATESEFKANLRKDVHDLVDKIFDRCDGEKNAKEYLTKISNGIGKDIGMFIAGIFINTVMSCKEQVDGEEKKSQ